MSGIRVRRGFRLPFSQVPEALLDWQQSGVSDRGVRLWGLLDRYVGSDGQVYPSRMTLARRLGCSTDTLDRTVKELERLGWLQVERRGALGATSLYTLLNPDISDSAGGRTDAAPPQGTRAAPGGRTPAAQKDSQAEREPLNEDPPAPPAVGLAAVEPDPVTEVYAYWSKVRAANGQTRVAALTPGRARVIRSRLRDGYSVAELCTAIDATFASTHHRQRSSWLDVTSCLGSSGKVDRHLADAGDAPLPDQGRAARLASAARVLSLISDQESA